jgi:hypothetical protein
VANDTNEETMMNLPRFVAGVAIVAAATWMQASAAQTFQKTFNVPGAITTACCTGYSYGFTGVINDPELTGNVAITSISVSAVANITSPDLINNAGLDWEVFIGPAAFGLPVGQVTASSVYPGNIFAPSSVQLRFAEISQGAAGGVMTFNGTYNFQTNLLTTNAQTMIFKAAAAAPLDLSNGLVLQAFLWSGALGSNITWTNISVTVAGTGGSPVACAVDPIAPVTDPVAQAFENSAPNAPTAALLPPDVQGILSDRMTSNVFLLALQTRQVVSRVSGYRPPAYQVHLHNIRETCTALTQAIRQDPAQKAACQDVRNQVEAEIAYHQPWAKVDANGCPAVNKAEHSLHSLFPALALDMGVAGLTAAQQVVLDHDAASFGLHRPCPSKAHYTLSGGKCDEVVKATAHSPIDIVVIDPLGRKVGFDSVSGNVVNELGESAWYSGRGSEPQFIEIGDVVPGTYTVRGIGTQTGPYQLELTRESEEGDRLASKTTSGTTTPGGQVELTIAAPVTVAIDIRPGGTPNSINPNNVGVIPVAILSSADFDAVANVETSSLTFGSTGFEHSLGFCDPGQDVNGDGISDLVCHFVTSATNFGPNDTQGVLQGTLRDGRSIYGIDWVNIVPK